MNKSLSMSASVDINYDQSYLERNPTWHVEDSPWKAEQVLKMLRKYDIQPNQIVEVGCGAGEILNQLYYKLGGNIQFEGYDISSDAIRLCQPKTKERLKFYLGDYLSTGEKAEVLLVMDVVEHVADYLGFLRKCAKRGGFKIYHFPLELSAVSMLRNNFLYSRKKVGHLHYFNKDTVLASLIDTGHTLVDCFYTPSSLLNSKWQTKLMNIPRQVLFDFNKDFAARLLGGYSLLVLTQ